MKNLLLLLILANILYFMWGLFATDDPQPGVAVVAESDLGPPLDVTTGEAGDTVAPAWPLSMSSMSVSAWRCTAQSSAAASLSGLT